MMVRRLLFCCIIILGVITSTLPTRTGALAPTAAALAQPAQPFAHTAFQDVWQRTDLPLQADAPGLQSRSWLWGPVPLTGGIQEAYAEGSNGVRLVQYFDKSRMEINDPAVGNVTNGLLVMEMIEGRLQVGDTAYEPYAPADQPVAGDPAAVNPNAPTYRSFRSVAFPVNAARAPDRTGQVVTDVLQKDGSVVQNAALAAYNVSLAYYDEQLGHNIPQVFTDYFAQQGIIYVDGAYTNGQIIDWLFVMGLPVSEPYWATVRVGGTEKDVLVQAFQRRVITYTPANDPEWRVEMGNVGQHYLNWRYASSQPVAARPEEPARAPAAPGGGEGTSTVIGEGMHIVTDVQGEVAFQREAGSYAPVQVGTALQNNDVLRLGSAAQATIACSGLYLVTADAATTEVRCDEGDPVLTNVKVEGERGPIDEVQVILAPRKTTLLDPNPTIRLIDAPDVTVTTVGIRGPGVNWTTEVNGRTTIRYPTTADELIPGNAYTINIEAAYAAPSTTLEPTNNLGISLLSTADAAVVRRQEARIRSLGMNDLLTNLLVAELYIGRSLFAEAREMLEEVPGVTEQAHGRLVLGDVHLAVGLNQFAKTHYQQALALAAQGDIALRADIHHQLGRTYKALVQTETAREHYQQARTLYEQLGDTRRVGEIEREMPGS
jgi:hypothetical protein